MKSRKTETIVQGIDLFLLALILATCFYGLFYYRHIIYNQIIVSIFLGVGYICWGVFHHWHLGDLKIKIVMEYTAMAALVVFVLVVFLLRV